MHTLAFLAFQLATSSLAWADTPGPSIPSGPPALSSASHAEVDSRFLRQMISTDERALPEIRAAYERLCASGDQPACLEAVMVQNNQEGLSIESLRALLAERQPAVEAACASGTAHACSLAGFVQAITEAPPSPQLALPGLYQGCDGGDAVGCFWLGAFAGESESLGVAFGHTRRACDLGLQPACYYVAGALEHGSFDQARDVARAEQLYRGACGDGIERACEGAQRLADQRSSDAAPARISALPTAVEALAEGLEANCPADARACFLLGQMYASDQLGEADPSRSIDLYVQGCEGGETRACGALAVAASQVPRSQRGHVAQVLESACRRKAPQACGYVGMYYAVLGEESHRYARRAAHTSAQGCAAGDMDLCVVLATCYRRGIGVDQDPARADATLAQACAQTSNPDLIDACASKGLRQAP